MTYSNLELDIIFYLRPRLKELINFEMEEYHWPLLKEVLNLKQTEEGFSIEYGKLNFNSILNEYALERILSMVRSYIETQRELALPPQPKTIVDFNAFEL